MLTSRQIHDLVQVYAEGPQLLDAALAGTREDEIHFSPGPEHWTIHENIVHVADVDLVAAARVRYLLGDPDGVPISFHGNRWARVMDYAEQPMDEALAVIRAVRNATAAMLRHLPAEAWERVGAKWKRVAADTEPETITLGALVEQSAERLRYHLRTVAKRRAQYAAAKGRAPLG